LHLLAGSPKVGKSWLALWLCHQVAKGESVWGFETFARQTLYLSLEDSLSRLHHRLSMITEDASEQALFATEARTLSDGLPEQIVRFTREKPQTGLIVIDTLQRVREISNEKNMYASDYIEIGRFKELADKLNIAILLIHHLRKMPDSDPFNMVSGTNGILGSVDGAFILEKAHRLENIAKLHITGRDIEDMQLTLEFDRECNIWKLLSGINAERHQHHKIVAALIARLCEKNTFSGTATQLSFLLSEIDPDVNMKPNQLMRILNDSLSLLEQKHGITITQKKSGGERSLTVSIIAS
jgi:uncharacterized membrane protein